MSSSQFGWSLDDWKNSNSSSPKSVGDWPDADNNSSFNFDDKDKSQQRQESGCNSTADCGSGFACIGRYCVKVDGRTATGGGNSNVSPGSDCDIDTGDGPTIPPDPCGGPTGGAGGGSVGGCTTAGCGGTGSGGGGAGDGDADRPLNCCGGPTYRVCSSAGCTESCTPPPPTPPSGCSQYCSNHNAANGSYGDGCSSSNTCSECQECSGSGPGSYCRPKSGAPCYCPGGAPCNGTCESCNRQSGQCEFSCEGCVDTCNCFVTCPCGKRITQNWSQPHCQSGLACSAACRANLAEKCGDYCEDPPLDPCKDDPNEPCSKSCSCTTLQAPCGAGKPSPPGDCSDTTVGYASFCGDGQAGYQSWIVKRCCGEPPDACKCDGPNAKSCGECMTCVGGRCKKDEACDNPCETEVCNGICCPAGQSCQQRCTTTVVDACHGQGYTFSHACNCRPRTTGGFPISKEDAVCDRYHTHCGVTCGGGQHLDCQAGLRTNGPSGGTTCG